MTGPITERQVMTEFLELYRDFPCLWYQSHRLYTNREARDQAYEVLLEKYRCLQEDATVDVIKKKIDNMRCAYKRERRKERTSMTDGTGYKPPTLWYYKLLSFIDGASDEVLMDDTADSQIDIQPKYEFEDESQDTKTVPKRKKVKREVSSVFIPESEPDLHDDGVEGTVSQSQVDILHDNSDENEAESFGRTVGLQLKELEPMQRFIAEKLISDVIFYGRLDKLNMQSNVSLNQGYQ